MTLRLLERIPTRLDRRPRARVLAIPGGHRYVRFAIGGDAADLQVIPDREAGPTQWLPSPALEPDWLRQHRHEFDLVHLHFGFEGRAPEQLADWAKTLQVLQIPLVMTVHDLQLPHERDQRVYRQQLAVLLAAADEVITLTPGAAKQIRREFGREALVLPHPRMVSLATIRGSARVVRDPIRVGIHLKSLRANVARGCVPAVARAARRLREEGHDVQLLVHAHPEIRDPSFPRYDAQTLAVLDQIATDDGVDVVWHERFTDRELWDYLAGLQVSVLPHRWGTHSGWLEECRDLGVVPVAGRVGYLAEQSGAHTFDWRGDDPEPQSLQVALSAAVAEAARGRSVKQAASWAGHRERTDRGSQQMHRRLYEGLVQARSGVR